MSNLQNLKDQLLQARKSKDDFKRITLSTLLGTIENQLTGTGESITDSQGDEIVLATVKSYIKNIDKCLEPETIESRIVNYNKEKEILYSLLPRELTEEEIKGILDSENSETGLRTMNMKDKISISRSLIPEGLNMKLLTKVLKEHFTD